MTDIHCKSDMACYYATKNTNLFIKQVPEAFQSLIDNVEVTLKHVLEKEEKISLAEVTNFEEVCMKITVIVAL